MTLAGILRHKGADVTTISPRARATEVIALLSQKRIGALLVCDAARQILGVVSERDIVRRIAAEGSPALERSAAELMSSPVHTASPGTSVAQAMTTMTQQRIRHLPVLDEDGELAGLVSIGDVVKALIDEQAAEVDSLRAYVAGSV